MRSILREKTQDYFKILQHDKSQWIHFWDNYYFENKDFMQGYTKTLALDKKTVELKLSNTNRPFLDKIKQKNDQIKHLKQNTAKKLNQYSKELELSKEDFVIYLIGALGIKDVVFFKSIKQHVILVDIVSLYGNNNIEKLTEIVLTSAQKVRIAINQKLQEVF